VHKVLSPQQQVFADAFASALAYGKKRFGKEAEPALLAKLIDTINEVRNSAPFGQQYKWDHSLREALNSLKCFDGADNEMMMEMRTRYKAMVAHFYSKIRAAQVPKTWKEQIPLTGKLETGPGGQIQAKL